MNSPFDLIDTESWPAIRGRILKERERLMNSLLQVPTLEEMPELLTRAWGPRGQTPMTIH